MTLYLCFQSVSWLLAVWLLSGSGMFPFVHKSPSHLSLFSSLTLPLSSSLWVFHGASCEIYSQIYVVQRTLCLVLSGGIYSPLRRVMHTEAFYILTLGNRGFGDIIHMDTQLIHISPQSDIKTLLDTFTAEVRDLKTVRFCRRVCLYFILKIWVCVQTHK